MHRQLFVRGRNSVSGGHSARMISLGDHFSVVFCKGLSANQVKPRSAIDNPTHQLFLNGANKTVGILDNFPAQFVRDELSQLYVPCSFLRAGVGPSYRFSARSHSMIHVPLGDGITIELDAKSLPESTLPFSSRGYPLPVEPCFLQCRL